MSQEFIPSPSPVERHIQTMSSELAEVPELQPVVDLVTTDPAHASDVYNVYLKLAAKMVSMEGADYDTVALSQSRLEGEVGSASTVGANDIKDELTERCINLASVVSTSFEPSSPYYQAALSEFISRLKGGHEMKLAGKTPSDHDPDSLKVIWGHTVITGQEALLHFVSMHYLERFVSKALSDQGVMVAQEKDFFINAMTDVVILNGLQNPSDPVFNLWETPKDQGGLGWITRDRLTSYNS